MDLLDTSLSIMDTVIPLAIGGIALGDVREAHYYRTLRFYCRASHDSSLRIYFANNLAFTNALIVTTALPAGVAVQHTPANETLLSKYIKAELENTSGILQTYLEAFIWLSR